MDFTRLVFFLLISFSSNFFGQELLYERFDNRHGLPSKEVYDLCLERAGYLIAATEFGVVKWNGERFEPICKNIPLSDRVFYSIKKNEKNEIYAANSLGKLYRIKDDLAIELKNTEALQESVRKRSNNVYDILFVDGKPIFVSFGGDFQ